jgi:predicted NAD/FAD-binding protein
MIEPGSRVLVVGGGAAGLAAAHAVSARHRVTLVEAERRLGGHAWTWHVGSGPDEGLPLDLGFMVMNDRNYPTMHRLLDRLGGVAIAVTEMSFGFWDDDAAFGFVVNGPPNVGAPDPRFLRLLKDLLRFQRRSQQDLDQGTIGERSLDEYLIALAVPAALADDYLIPMGAAIWSTAPADLRRYPARAFLAFFRHHGLLSLEPPPRWQYLPGGSCRYVEALLARTPGLRVIHERALRLERTAGGVSLRLVGGARIDADYAIIATQADQALALLDRPSATEHAGLAPWTYQTNHAVLHTDQRAMPARSHWGCWNARRTARNGDLVLTYYLNRLQNHATAAHDYFLTLAAGRDRLPEIASETMLLETTFRHPMFSHGAMAGVHRLDDDDACERQRTFFCGSYFGYGFHEDAIRSGERAARRFEGAA